MAAAREKKCLKCCGWQISPELNVEKTWPALSVAAWPGKDKSQWLLTRDANANRDKGIDAPVMALKFWLFYHPVLQQIF
jgi:hypothetical protein